MASQRLRRRARTLSRPQVRAAQRSGGREVRALGSEGRALQQNISRAGHDFRHIPGLRGRDQRIALENLAQQRVSAAGGIASQQSAARADTRGTVSDLRQQAVSDLIAQRTADAHDVAMAKLNATLGEQATRQGSKLDLRNSLAQAAFEAQLPSSSSTSGKGLTPYEQRGVKQNRQNALGLVRSAYEASASGAEGAPPAPKTTQDWQRWGDLLYQKYHTTVDRGDIHWAIGRLQGQQLKSLPQNPVLQALSHLLGG